MQRRRLIQALALAPAASLGVAPFARAQAVEKPRLTIAVGGKNLLYYLPLTIAEGQGYFKAEGLDITIADFAGGSRALQALVGGSADVVSGAFEHTINMQVKGQRLRAFALQGRAPQIVLGINPKTMPNFKSVAELKGKKLGVTAPGSSTNVLANFVLAKVGLKPGDVSIIGVGTGSGAVAAMRTGQIDAISNLDPVITAPDAQRRPEDRLRHAHRRRGRPGVRRADAGRLPLHPAVLPRQVSADGAGPGERAGARRQVGPGGRRR
jgi:NitT/TauT family transport system substrate-binding protein